MKELLYLPCSRDYVLTNQQPRFPSSTLHQRDPRSALFENYNGGNHNQTQPNPGSSSNHTASPYSGGYGYPASSSSSNGVGQDVGGAANGGFRTATPNRRGQYSDAVLNELESQNDGQVEGILGKVRMLKDVCFSPFFSLPLLPVSVSWWVVADGWEMADDNSNWRRDQRFFGAGGENE